MAEYAPNVNGIVCEFASYEALDTALVAGNDEQELALPCRESVRDGEWLVVTVTVAAESTSVAGRVEERGRGLCLTFQTRDWERLLGFARGGEPPSIPPAERASTPQLVRARPGTRVLVVDDDSAVQGIVGAMLETSGIAALNAGSAEEAYGMLSGAAVDLVVLDWSLPGMSGVDLCKKLRGEKRFGSLPILFLTAHSTSDELITAFDAGADDFVSKPFRAPELKARVLGLLRRAQMPCPPS
ncbi:MAG TPA: response regulator transcription factor [Polyangiaceae bacterium]|nr:response regulator transcription factor [Polyangiaceae bacterium]